MQFREIVRPLDRSNRRNDVDREGGEEDQRESKLYIGRLASFPSGLWPRLTLAKFLKRKKRWRGRRGKWKGRGEKISSSRGDEVVGAKAIGEHRLIICRSKDVMETATASI